MSPTRALPRDSSKDVRQEVEPKTKGSLVYIGGYELTKGRNVPDIHPGDKVSTERVLVGLRLTTRPFYR